MSDDGRNQERAGEATGERTGEGATARMEKKRVEGTENVSMLIF